MPAYTYYTTSDGLVGGISSIRFTIFNTESDNIHIGFLSDSASALNPETGNKIEGFKWDNLRWPNPDILNDRETIPVNWDASRIGIEAKRWQAGVGSLYDLKVQREIKNRYIDSKDKWIPEVEHGYFYVNNVEHFMYSDGAWTEYIDYLDTKTYDSTVFNYKTLAKIPSGTAPIYIRQYERHATTKDISIRGSWRDRGVNPIQSETSVEDLQIQNIFTGNVVSGVEQPTFKKNSGVFTKQYDASSIAASNGKTLYKEFLRENTDTASSVLLNSRYTTEQIGVVATGFADVINCEKVGTSNGNKSQEFFTKVFPISSLVDKVWQVDVAPTPVYVDKTSDFNSSTNADYQPFPISEATGDYAAFGFSKQFTQIRFDYANGTAGIGGVVTWEYWNGASWTALAGIVDNTTNFTAAAGDNKLVSWTKPADWERTAINNSVELYYIRARVTTVYTTNPVLDQGFIANEQSYDATRKVRVYTSNETSTFQEWIVVPDITTAGPLEYKVQFDYDLGILLFGDDITGEIPVANEGIYITYTPVLEVKYEPEDRTNLILATQANTNPIYRSQSSGFVVIKPANEYPFEIKLTAPDLKEIGVTEKFGPVGIGNLVTRLLATVEDRSANLLEDESVTFEILSGPTVTGNGGFGGQTSIISITDGFGKARAFYRSPATINSIGEVISDADKVTQVGGNTEFTLTNLKLDVDSTTDIFIYKVMSGQPLVGLNQADFDSYYTDFFTNEEIAGFTATSTYEQSHRLVAGLPLPKLYEGLSGGTGSGYKVLISAYATETTDEDGNTVDVLNPYTGEVGAFYPVRPLSVDTSGKVVTFSGGSATYPDPSPVGNLQGYFIAGLVTVTFRASVYNALLGKRIYSNNLQIQLFVSDSMSGIWKINALNDIPAELASTFSSLGRVPFGWRLRSGISLASALDGLIFLNPEQITGLGQKFTVDTIV